MNHETRSLNASAAEVLALAFCSLFPEAQLLSAGIDGVGFYYDFNLQQKVDNAFIPRLEELMRGFFKSEEPITVFEMMRENAAQLFLHKGQAHKAELVKSYPFNIIPIVSIGDFRDYAFENFLSALPAAVFLKILSITPRLFYLDSFGEIPAVRVYGAIFSEKKDLKAFVKQLESKRENEHKTLGKEMGLFTAGEAACEGEIRWLPKGAQLRELLLGQFRRDHERLGFAPFYSQRVVDISTLSKEELLANKGFPHFEQEEVEYIWSPLVAKENALAFCCDEHSASELPLRFFEYVDSYEGVLPQHLDGLLKSRSFTADYATVFCSASQVVEELISSLQYIDKIITIIGAKFRWALVSRGKKRAGTADQWTKALRWISEAVNTCGITLDEESCADEILAGPQIQVLFADAFGREWCGPKIRMNFYLPAQHALCYHECDGSKHRPVMLERTAFGSLERSIALMLESSNGMLPLAFAPEQFRIIPVGPENQAYSKEILKELQRKGYRAKLDCNLSSLGAKIHSAERARVPYAFIIGKREQNEKMVSVRSSGAKGKTLRRSLEDFLEHLKAEGVLAAETLN